jgi:hypothetical protein
MSRMMRDAFADGATRRFVGREAVQWRCLFLVREGVPSDPDGGIRLVGISLKSVAYAAKKLITY